MPRNPPPRPPQGPTLSPEQARIKLESSLKRAKELLQEQPLTEARHKVWSTNTFGVLQAAFGENSGHLYTFSGQARFSPYEQPEHYREAERRKKLTRQIEFLKAVIEDFPAVDAQTHTTGSDFFNHFDTDIRRVSEPLFKGGHYADSVLAAFRELNDQVKREYKRRKNDEPDGADLMRRAFSPNNPVFVLADQSTESGQNVQQGFMDIFAGSMTGIRNPHAHGNLPLDPDEAKHLLYLAVGPEYSPELCRSATRAVYGQA